MDLLYILCVFVLSVLFLSDFVVLSCVAAVPSCPVRFVLTSEVEGGYKCVCRRNYYGTNCRFKARNKSIDADAQWLTNSSAIVTWQGQYGENFRLFVRQIIYENNGTVYSSSKWFQAKVTSITMELSAGNISTGVILKPGTPGKVTSVLYFPAQNENYEVYLAKITSTGDVNGSVSIFFDSDNILVFDEKNVSGNQSNETAKCAWFQCPAQFFHVNAIIGDFGKPCFMHGAIVAVPVTIFGTMFIATLIYIVIRQYKRAKNQKRNTTESGSEAEFPDNENVRQTRDNETLKSCLSCVIDIPENKTCAVNEDLKSFVVTLDDIEALRPPSIHWTDEESLSQSSAGSTLTRVTPLSTLSVSSLNLSEGEIVF